jgi:hypothetical protein
MGSLDLPAATRYLDNNPGKRQEISAFLIENPDMVTFWFNSAAIFCSMDAEGLDTERHKAKDMVEQRKKDGGVEDDIAGSLRAELEHLFVLGASRMNTMQQGTWRTNILALLYMGRLRDDARNGIYACFTAKGQQI